MKKYISNSDKETFFLAKTVLKNYPNSTTFALIGDLGSGKTTFTKGFAKALGIKENITSPTFNIIKLYKVPITSYGLRVTNLCHIDAYRLTSFKDLEELGVNNYFNSPQTLTVVEWADKIKSFLPKNTLIIEFKAGKKENQRIISTKNLKSSI